MPDKIALQNDTSNTKPEKEKAKRWLDRWSVRIGLLLIAALGGLLLAKHGGFQLVKLRLINLTIASNRQLAILLMSLPVFFVLWIFRTWDTRELIKKTGQSADAAMMSAIAATQSAETATQSAETAKQSEKTARENVETAQKSLAANTLARNIDMLSSNDLMTRCIGLIQLAEMKRQGNFVKEIDRATRQNIKLNGAIFRGENLSGVNLERAELVDAIFSEGTNLSGASLQNTNMHNAKLLRAVLKEANLQGACLTEADFMGADLENANLCNADLSTAKNLESAKLEGAKYNGGTKLPEIFGQSRWEQRENTIRVKMKYVS